MQTGRAKPPDGPSPNRPQAIPTAVPSAAIADTARNTAYEYIILLTVSNDPSGLILTNLSPSKDTDSYACHSGWTPRQRPDSGVFWTYLYLFQNLRCRVFPHGISGEPFLPTTPGARLFHFRDTDPATSASPVTPLRGRWSIWKRSSVKFYMAILVAAHSGCAYPVVPRRNATLTTTAAED